MITVALYFTENIGRVPLLKEEIRDVPQPKKSIIEVGERFHERRTISSICGQIRTDDWKRRELEISSAISLTPLHHSLTLAHRRRVALTHVLLALFIVHGLPSSHHRSTHH